MKSLTLGTKVSIWTGKAPTIVGVIVGSNGDWYSVEYLDEKGCIVTSGFHRVEVRPVSE